VPYGCLWLRIGPRLSKGTSLHGNANTILSYGQVEGLSLQASSRGRGRVNGGRVKGEGKVAWG